MSMQLRGISGADIQMVLLQMLFIGVFEGFPILYPKVAFVDISDIFQLANNRIKNRIILDYHVDIYAWLCRHSLNGCASDVLDSDDYITDCVRDFFFYFLEVGFPSLIVRKNNNLFSLHFVHLNQNPITMVNLVLDDLCGPAGVGFNSCLKLQCLILDLD